MSGEHMYGTACRLILCCTILCFLHFSVYVFGEHNSTESDGAAHNAGNYTENLTVLPAAGISLRGGYYFNNNPGYRALLHKTVDLHLLRYKSLFASFLVSEDTLFRDHGERTMYPYKIKYIMDYINLSWDFGRSYLGVVVDHICYNLIDQVQDTDPYELRWYGIGIKWESHGMKTGLKNSGFHFNDGLFRNFPFALNFMGYYGRSLYTERFEYTYISRGALRIDFLMLRPFVLYAETNVQALIDDRIRFDPSGELGLRVRCGNADIIPYVRYLYQHDSELFNDAPRSYWMAGLGFETLLGTGKWGTPEIRGEALPAPGVMEMHFSGAYTKFYGSMYNGYRSDIALYIDIVRINNLSVVCNNRMYHDSKAAANALFPRYITYTFQGGLEYRVQPLWVLQGMYQHERRHDGNTYRGHEENYHLAGVSVKTIGMKPGYGTIRIARSSLRGMHAVNTFDAGVSAGRILGDMNYPYRWDLRGQVRWDTFQAWNAVHYLGGDVHLLLGEDNEREYGVETGFRFLFGVSATLYYRYEKQVNIDFVSGAEELHHMAGVKIEI